MPHIDEELEHQFKACNCFNLYAQNFGCKAELCREQINFIGEEQNLKRLIIHYARIRKEAYAENDTQGA